MKKIKKGKFILFGLLIFFLGLGFSTNIAQAQQGNASLFLSPSSGSFQTGSTFSLTVAARSEQQAMNAAEAVLRFDPSFVRVRSISKVNSIFAFWPVEPTFSNAAGTINFTGGSPTPFRGANGRIIAITFEALKEGTASVNFTQGKILAADGLGTDITGNLIGGNYTITRATAPEPALPLPQTPQAPKISSLTHPDPEKWYNNNSPKFSWNVPDEITAIRLLLGESSTAQPNLIYEPPISSYSFEDVEDGIWYFSVQLRNRHGWGGIDRFKIQIDTVPPEPFSVEVDNENDLTNPAPIFYFKAEDDLSGIDYYEIILNDELYARVSSEDMEEGLYRPLALSPDDYSLIVKAVDRAGNESSAFTEFSVLGIFFEMDKLPSKIKAGEFLEIKGKTLPGTIVRFYFEKEGEETLIREIISDGQGNFQLQELLKRGKYFIWAEAEDRRGALSEPMEKHVLEVAPDTLSFFLLIFLIVLIIVGVFIIWILWKRISEDKEKTKKEEVEEKVETKQKSYDILKEQIKKQVEYLEEKVDLSRAEARLLNELRKALEESEGAKEKEIENYG